MSAVSISCPVFPSEDPERVRQAVLNIFPDADLDMSDGTLSGETDSVEHFGAQIRRQRILDAVRSVLIKGRRGGNITFNLNKQAAFAGKISFAEEKTILGTIRVTLRSDDITSFIEKLAPQTVDGEEVFV